MLKPCFRSNQPRCGQDTPPGVVSSRACVLYGARWVLAPVREVIHLIHGPVGCAYNSSKVRGKDYPIFSTAMDEQDVVFGGIRKLHQSISDAIRLQPSAHAVLVYTTCITGLIGEDVAGVCRDASAKHGLPVIHVDCPGFSGVNQSTGHDKAVRVLFEHFIDCGDSGPVLEKCVNILGEFDVGGDLEEIERLLNQLGLNVICVISGRATPENMALARRAELNIVHCRRTGGLLAQLMEERYNTRQLKVSFFGLAETTKAIQDIGRFFDINSGKLDAWTHKEADAAKQKAAPYLQKLSGKRVAMFFGASRIASMSRAFRELGMEIILAGSQCGSRKDYSEASCHLKEKALMIDDASMQELMEFLLHHQPDLMIGGTKEKFIAHKLGIPFLVFPQQNNPYTGFNGFVNLAREAAAIVTAPVWGLINPDFECER